jgi:predicted AlkP superfamily pyrophosphatase or phosphodiesterase
MPYRAFLGLLLAACLTACAGLPPLVPQAPSEKAGVRPLTILISIDGFRPDYMTRAEAPTLSSLAESGVVAPRGMRPSFPSITFPNHYSLVTGRRPDNHGIVANVIEDPRISEVPFTLGNKAAVTDRRWWDEAEPLWVTAEKSGVRTATMFWPGSEAAIHGVRPSQWAAFDQSLSSAARVDVLLGWLRDPARRPGLATLYFDIVDTAGHRFGPDSDETRASVAEVDRAILQLIEGLKTLNLDGQVNLVIVADHGMAAVPVGQTIISDQADPGAVRMVYSGASAGFALKSGQEARGEAALLRPHDNMTCWRKSEIPARLAFGKNPRVPAIICIARVGWYISNAESAARRRPETRTTGAHGYDNAAPEMAALFVASGPSIRKGGKAPDMDNVDVYSLLAALIGVTPAPSDGRLPEGVLKRNAMDPLIH